MKEIKENPGNIFEKSPLGTMTLGDVVSDAGEVLENIGYYVPDFPGKILETGGNILQEVGDMAILDIELPEVFSTVGGFLEKLGAIGI